MWQTPKTNWAPPDPVGPSDFNRMESNTAHLKTALDGQYPRIIKAGIRYPANGQNPIVLPGGFTVPEDKMWMLFIQPLGDATIPGQVFGELGTVGQRKEATYNLNLDAYGTLDINTSASIGKIEAVRFDPVDEGLSYTLLSDTVVRIIAGSDGYQGTVNLTGDLIITMLYDTRHITYQQGGQYLSSLDFLLLPGVYANLDAVHEVAKIDSGKHRQPFTYLLLEVDQALW